MRCHYPARTFAEKIKHKIEHDRNPLLPLFADKVAVRKYVTEKVGAEYLPQLYQVAESFEELEWEKFPSNVAFKPNHASGLGIIFSQFAPPVNLSRISQLALFNDWLFLNPQFTHQDMVESIAKYWISGHYLGWEDKEWAYHNIPKRLMVEELIQSAEGHLPFDYRFHCFGGEFKLLMVTSPRVEQNFCVNYYYPNFDQIDVKRKKTTYSTFPEPLTKPSNFATMVEIAQILSQTVDFLRVDLFELNGRIVVSELTNYPLAGDYELTPDSYNTEFGSFWPDVDY